MASPNRLARPRRQRLAARLAVLAVAVGATVTAISAYVGVSACRGAEAEAAGLPGDRVCYDLVRTLSEREGIVAAAATVVFALMMLGLSRLADATAEQ
jgi:hypothetical protein